MYCIILHKSITAKTRKGGFVMDRGSELMKEQLICKVEANLAKAIKAQRIANLTTKELHRLLDVL